MTTAEKCPRCGEKMQRIYVQGTENHKRVWMPIGWVCINPTCKGILLDEV